MDDRIREILKRKEDCPASEICNRLGNQRKGCLKGSTEAGLNVCMASLILLADQIVQGLAEKDQ